MTKFFDEGILIEVDMKDAQPTAFIWNKQKHLINVIDYHWRLNVEWWKSPTWRDYYQVVTDTGVLAVVYHDLETDNWFLQLLYD